MFSHTHTHRSGGRKTEVMEFMLNGMGSQLERDLLVHSFEGSTRYVVVFVWVFFYQAEGEMAWPHSYLVLTRVLSDLITSGQR